MIHDRYESAFCALTPEELQCCLEGLLPAHPDLGDLADFTEGRQLLEWCRQTHVSQAEVILALRNDSRPHAVTAVERIMMRPIDRRNPVEVERERDKQRPRPAVVATVKASEATTDLRIIRILVDKNPKRAGTSAHDRFAKYVDGATVAETLKRGLTRGDLAWDQERSLIRLDPEA